MTDGEDGPEAENGPEAEDGPDADDGPDAGDLPAPGVGSGVDPHGESDRPAGNDPPDDAPTITCRRCDREWDLDAELSRVGNQAFEQFALDHRRHTGHFPDGVETWRAVCRHCPEAVERLGESQARRWGRTHVRHTRHRVEIRSGEGEPDVLGPDEDRPDDG